MKTLPTWLVKSIYDRYEHVDYIIADEWSVQWI